MIWKLVYKCSQIETFEDLLIAKKSYITYKTKQSGRSAAW